MKIIIALISVAILSLCSSFSVPNSESTMTTVMTYNIHIEHSTDQPSSWDERKSMVAQLIRSREPDVLGIQESTLSQIEWLSAALNEYAYYAPGEGKLKLGTDLCPIMYSEEVYEKLDEGTFLIGEAVLESDTTGRQSQFLNWVKLKHIKGEKIVFVLNTRFQNIESKNGNTIAERMQAVISSLVGESTFFLLGDLDCTPESSTVSHISNWAKDSFNSSFVSISEQDATHFGWEPTQAGERVDYVFLSDDILANSYEVIDVSLDNEYPSDHLPVFCRVRIQ
jgi:endonuclease/exonuclease/phosphatase family metal-dependent hydrolase